METLSFYIEETNSVLTISIARSDKLKPTEGYFNPWENQILLGAERHKEWTELYGNAGKQKAFIHSLPKVYRKSISN